jgi:phosphate transport system substrate-binding protein
MRAMETPGRSSARSPSRVAAALAALAALASVAALAAPGCRRDPTLQLEALSSTHASALLAGMTAAYPEAHVRFHAQTLGSHESARQKIVDKDADFFVTEGPVPLVGTGQLRSRPIVVPLGVGGVAIVHHLRAGASLRLTKEALVDVFLGKIKRWDDPALAAIEGNAALPASEISVVYRQDQSGTTAVFAQLAESVRPEWRATAGDGLVVKWPVGTGVEGNAAIVDAVQKREGTIAILPASVAFAAKLPIATLRNDAGRFVSPDAASLTAAARGQAWPPNEPPPSLVGRPDPAAYPLACFVYVVFDEGRLSQPKVEALARFLAWAMRDGQMATPGLPFGALPPAMADTYAPGLHELTEDRAPAPAL